MRERDHEERENERTKSLHYRGKERIVSIKAAGDDDYDCLGWLYVDVAGDYNDIN